MYINMNQKTRGLLVGFVILTMTMMSGCSSADEYEPKIPFYIFHDNNQQFPAWLRIGKELIQGTEEVINTDINVHEWYAKAVSRGLPSLGDEWFIPGFTEDDLAAYVLCVTYAFVRHLEETGRLDNLTALYLQDETLWDAENARALLWANFAEGVPNVRTTIFQYFSPEIYVYVAGWDNAPVAITALTRQAKYYFTTSRWTRDNIEHYIEVSEEAITFVGNFLDYHHNEPLTIIVYAPPHNKIEHRGEYIYSRGGRYMSNAAIAMFNVPEEGPIAIAHEVVHATLSPNSMRDGSNFPIVEGMGYSSFLEEGLCDVLEFMFYSQTESDRFSILMTQFYLDVERRMTWDMAVNHIHRQASTDIRHNQLASMRLMRSLGHENYVQAARDLPFWQLQSHSTAASFIIYLTEHRGTWEDLFRVYADYNLMEEVYGVDMEEMIAQWLSYVGVRR